MATTALPALERPLCVDLDGTLVKSDTLVDSLLLLVRTRPLDALKTPLWAFAKRWRLSQKDLTELRSRAVDRLKERLAAKNIHSLEDII